MGNEPKASSQAIHGATHDGHRLRDPPRDNRLCPCDVCNDARLAENAEIELSGADPFTPEDIEVIREAWAHLAASEEQILNTVRTSVGLYYIEMDKDTGMSIYGGRRETMYASDPPFADATPACGCCGLPRGTAREARERDRMLPLVVLGVLEGGGDLLNQMARCWSSSDEECAARKARDAAEATTPAKPPRKGLPSMLIFDPVTIATVPCISCGARMVENVCPECGDVR